MQERKRLDVTVVYLHQAFISFVVLYKRGFVMFGVVSLTMGNSAMLATEYNRNYCYPYDAYAKKFVRCLLPYSTA